MNHPNVLLRAESFLRKPQVPQRARNSPRFIEHEGSLPPLVLVVSQFNPVHDL